MLQLANNHLPNNLQRVLKALQARVDAQGTFENAVNTCQALWKTKGNLQGRQAFERLSERLKTMCVYVNVCNYCEQNEANDIEHIYPKSFFPEKTFNWDNYILACKQCNTAYKLDQCFVLDENGDLHEILRGEQPVYPILAFINPRTEDPNTFLWLDMQTRKFEIRDNLSTVNQNKAEGTLYILELNERDLLLEDRKNTAIYYYQRMELLTKILAATSIPEIEELLTPYDDRIDKTLPLDELKQSLKNSFAVHLGRFKHPSVWHSIKTIERVATPKWKSLFDQIPEAVNW